jgi:[ribosomal protein S5]-alanine N-acetyltransferase
VGSEEEMILKTERLMVRSWRESDVDCYMTLAKDVGYNCFAPPGFFLADTVEEARAKIQQRMALFGEHKLGKFPVFLKDTGEFVGTCGIEPYELDGRSEVELGYRLCLNHWGKGYAAEAARAVLCYAFEDLELEKILGLALPQNRASLKILEKLGFQYRRDFVHAGLTHRLYEFARDCFAACKVREGKFWLLIRAATGVSQST